MDGIKLAEDPMSDLCKDDNERPNYIIDGIT